MVLNFNFPNDFVFTTLKFQSHQTKLNLFFIKVKNNEIALPRN